MKNQRLMHMAAMGLQDDDEAMQFLHVPDDGDPPADREVIILEDGTIVGQGQPLVLFAGPCVIESREHVLYMAERIQTVCMEVGINFVFKSSFDKANRSSIGSYRGPGITAGLDILSEVKERVGCPILTDIHEPWQAEQAAVVADIIQIPAFLCRQTDLLIAAADTGKAINVKKAQFVAPLDMIHVIEKIEEYGNGNIILTERGTSFGYNNLVVDMRSLAIMRNFGVPVCFDATHSTQLPGGGVQSGGNADYAPLLARAATAVGIDALFMEVHDNPGEALSDSTSQLALSKLQRTLIDVLKIHEIVSLKED